MVPLLPYAAAETIESDLALKLSLAPHAGDQGVTAPLDVVRAAVSEALHGGMHSGLCCCLSRGCGSHNGHATAPTRQGTLGVEQDFLQALHRLLTVKTGEKSNIDSQGTSGHEQNIRSAGPEGFFTFFFSPGDSTDLGLCVLEH